jgi:hypothetical protein
MRDAEFMLQNIKDLYGYKLAALDGEIGQVKDFYFDDKIWVVRYVVADTGPWLTGRLVLLSPHAFGTLEPREKTLRVGLDKKRIENSPSIESHRPVSRQYEEEYFHYYGWPTYWSGGGMWGGGGYPTILPPYQDEPQILGRSSRRSDDKHLQSAQSVTGYHVQAVDGTMGHVSGFVVDARSWAIRELSVETGHWYAGREILISTDAVERIGYDESKVFVSLTQTEIRQAAESGLAKVHVH